MGVAGLLVALVLFVGVQWLTAPGAPVPTAPPASVEAPTPQVTDHSTVGLPNHARTPGAINPAATKDNLASTVCKPGWATSVRPPSAYTSALKLVQIVQYGYTDRNPTHYQEDHLVPLELGGAPRDPRNLWPEPNNAVLPDGTVVGSHAKDALENALHADVCAGTLSLDQAQRDFAVDWIVAWEAAGRP